MSMVGNSRILRDDAGDEVRVARERVEHHRIDGRRFVECACMPPPRRVPPVGGIGVDRREQLAEREAAVHELRVVDGKGALLLEWIGADAPRAPGVAPLIGPRVGPPVLVAGVDDCDARRLTMGRRLEPRPVRRCAWSAVGTAHSRWRRHHDVVGRDFPKDELAIRMTLDQSPAQCVGQPEDQGFSRDLQRQFRRFGDLHDPDVLIVGNVRLEPLEHRGDHAGLVGPTWHRSLARCRKQLDHLRYKRLGHQQLVDDREHERLSGRRRSLLVRPHCNPRMFRDSQREEARRYWVHRRSFRGASPGYSDESTCAKLDTSAWRCPARQREGNHQRS